MSLVRGIAVAGVGVAAASSLALLLVWAEFAALGRLLQSPDAASRDPLAADLSITFTTVGAFALASGITRVSLGFRWTWLALGGALAWFALAVSLLALQLSFLPLLPAVGWCVLELALRPHTLGRAAVSAVVLVGIALVVFVPVRAQLLLALSLRFPVALAAAWVAVLAIAWPVFGWFGRPFVRVLGVASIVAGLVSLALVTVKVPGGHQGVEWLNLRHATDAENGTARFEASTFGAALPHEVAKAAPWERATTPPFPWMSLDRSMFVAPAVPLDAPPPTVEVLSTEKIESGRRLKVRVRSQRSAPRLHLHLPESVSIEAVEWRGQRLDDGFEGVKTQLLFAFEEDGVDFVLVDRAAEPSAVHVIDQDWSWSAEHEALRERRFSYSHIPRSDGDIVFVGARCELR